ncbi:hypothetical protein FGO68_gene7073 [Halteria grandinella]|uniref:ABC3 transporter permease C-terminal domain-containing protein n=1 Tax=Halteria grandinella TaxID=5974 RepID=A0A8J8NFS8_HALGN|nr:hypothetical protein FGO68_gene7073 [Halteria grandinella]
MQTTLVNLTALQNSVGLSNPDIEGLYPRWITLAQLSNPTDTSIESTGSFITHGDQRRERDLKVASGFPEVVMGKKDAIVSGEILEMLSLNEGDLIEIKYDLLKFLPANLKGFETLIFDYKPEKEGDLSKGQLFLQMLDIEQEQLLIDFYKEMLDSYGEGTGLLVDEFSEFMGYDSLTPLYMVLDSIFDSLIREDFHLHMNYTILQSIDKSFSKWPSAFGNAIFLDSTYLFENLLEMIHSNALRAAERNQQESGQIEGVFTVVEDYMRVNNVTEGEYAMMAHVMLSDRMQKYMADDGSSAGVADALNRIYSGSERVLFETTGAEMSIVERAKNMQMMKPILTNMFHTIIFFMVFLSIILNQSLVHSDVEERRYEFAMLRTLGHLKSQLVHLLFLQTALFSFPALILGVIVMLLMLVAIRVGVFYVLSFPLNAYIDTYTVVLAIFLGVILPQLSNLAPIRDIMASSLRDSLDIARRSGKGDQISISMTKLKDFGVSPIQLVIGLTFTVVGFTVYYFVPLAVILNQTYIFFFVMLSLLMGMILGMLLIGSALVPNLERGFLTLLMLFRCNKDAKLKTIIKKNLQAHAGRNHKTSLMFMITITFLIFCSSGNTQFEYLIQSITSAVLNADIALFIANVVKGAAPIVINEKIIREYLDGEISKDNSIIRGYNFIGWTLNEVFTKSTSQGQFEEMWIGFGMKNLEFYGVGVYGLEHTHLDEGLIEYYYPEETLSEVVDSEGTVHTGYGEREVLKLLRELSIGNRSGYEYWGDQSGLQSIEYESAQNQTQTSTQLINIVIPEAFRQQLPLELGDIVELKVGNHGQQIDFRCKIIGSLRRMPGLWDFSAYKPAVWITPGVIVSQEQYDYIVKEYLKAFPNEKPQYEARMASIPEGATFNIPKKTLQLTLKEDVSRLEMNRLTNKLVALAGESNVFGFNVRKFKEELSTQMIILLATSWAVGLVLFLMTFFQITVSLTASLKEDSQELGVLRAIGLTKSSLTLVALYEQLSTLLSAILIGLIVGLVSSSMVNTLLMNFAELPFVLLIPWGGVVGMIVTGLVTIVVGTLIGVRGINRKNITTILKGQA